MKTHTSSHLVLAVALLGGLTAPSIQAQLAYNTPEAVISENFDSLGISSVRWYPNSTLPGWYMYRSNQGAIDFTINLNDGTNSTVGAFNMGQTGNSNRSLGVKPGATPGDVSIVLQLKNNTGETLTSFDLSYLGEVWRLDNATARSINFSYQISSTALDKSTITTGIWTAAPSLDFITTSVDGDIEAGPFPGLVLDGSSANYSSLVSATVSGITWEDGQYLYLNWTVPTTSATPTLAIDNVVFSASVAPIPELGQTALLLSLSIMGFLFGARRKLA